MENETPVAAPPSMPHPFKKWVDCEKAFKHLKPPIIDSARDEFPTRLESSHDYRYFAFRLLTLRAFGDYTTKLSPFAAVLESMLAGGRPLVKLEELTDRESVGPMRVRMFRKCPIKG